MSNWFTQLSRRERSTFWACFSGWALDAMDVQLYAVAMPTLIGLWTLTSAQAGVLATSALVVSSIGGWIAGMLADRIGRVRVLQITIIWFASFTALSGLTRSYEELLLTRSLQGLGFGGEWAAGAVLMAEVIRPEARGRAVGTVQSGWSVGYGLAALLFTVSFSFFPAEEAWRYLFFAGLIPAVVLVLYIRRNVQEPEIFVASRDTRDAAGATEDGVRFLDIFKPPLRRSTIVASFLAAGALGGNYTILTWLPTYLKTVRNLTVLSTGSFLAVNILGSFLGYVICAHLSDYFGRRRTFAVSAVFAVLTVSVYTLVPVGQAATLLLGFPLGFFQSGLNAGMGATFAELFPTRVRGTGQGFCYNFGRGIGSLMPATVGALAAIMPLSRAIGVCAVASYMVVLIQVFFLRETRGMQLDSLAPRKQVRSA